MVTTGIPSAPFWYTIGSILEPSAGKGDLLKGVGRAVYDSGLGYDFRPSISLVEIDPGLRGILQEEFMSGHSFHDKARDLMFKDKASQTELDLLREYRAMDIIQNCKPYFVHYDFLQYETFSSFSLIVMNPPFADGDAHLLKAISMQERTGGMIRCILNAETLLNPYTNRRKLLVKKLKDLEAEITFRDSSFEDAERKTDVQVAIIKLNIPAPKKESIFFEKFHLAEAVKLEQKEATEIAVNDFCAARVAQYRVEVQSGLALIQEYNNLAPYIQDRFSSKYSQCFLRLRLGDHDADPEKYVCAVRLKYWEELFSNSKLMAHYTSELQRSVLDQVREMKTLEFDEFNICRLLTEMNARMVDAIKEQILKLFETMTVGYHWRDEPTVENIHYYNGWATNKAHFINKKVILPCYGVFPDYKWSRDTFRTYEAYDKLIDIERVLNYLDGNMTAPVDLRKELENANRQGITRNIPCKFFTVTFYKKGTMHITFTNQELLDRFNIYCCRAKNWLPPCYGRKKYADMTEEEKAVVDSFNGGEAAYEKIYTQAAYYLAPASQTVPSLPAAATC